MKSLTILSAASVLALAVASSANAQTQPADAAAKAAGSEDIIVTGSRIARAGFEAPTPVTAVQTDSLVNKAPGTIADGLNQLPQFQNSISGNTRGTGNAASVNSGNYLNLRALGPNRVLVLQDGQRMPVTGNNGGVDVSLIPSMLIQRVEVVTGGASAVYGSDAVSGVVNFILDKHMTGLKFVGQGGMTTNGNVPSYRIGAAGGISLMDGRLHIVASAERNFRSQLYRRWFPVNAEGWGLQATSSATNPGLTAANPYTWVNNVRALTLSAQGIATIGGTLGQFDSNGNFGSFNTGTAVLGVAGTASGGDGGYFDQTNGTVGAGMSSNQFFIRPEYEFANGMKAFVSLGYNTSLAQSDPGAGFIRAITIFSGNPYLTPAEQTLLGSAASFNIGRIFTDGPTHFIRQNSNSTNINAGLEGNFNSSVKWNLGYVHSITDFRSSQHDIKFPEFYAAMDAVRAPNGNIVCNATLSTNPTVAARYAGCVPFNPLGLGRGSQAGYNYFWGDSFWTTKNKMEAFMANMTGELLNLPAGPLSFAVGAERRYVSINQNSNADPRFPPDFTGLRGTLSTQLTQFRLTNNGVASGSQKVTEFYGEVEVPVLKDSAIGTLSVNGAARMTDYSTSGEVKTWKLGTVFEPVDGVKFRATVSRDIRAPTLFELFAATQATGQSFPDDLTGQNNSLQIISGGNSKLKPEIAKTLTAGIVLTPHAIPGLSLSVDYYRINITDAIAQPYTAAQVLSLCNASIVATGSASGDTCKYVLRPISPTSTASNNFPLSLQVVNDNLANQLVKGIDFELAYGSNLGGGRMNARLLATRLITFDQTTAPGRAPQHLAGTADFAATPLPKWRGSFSLDWTKGGFTIGGQERLIGSFDRSHPVFNSAGVATFGTVYAQNKVPTILYTDVNASYKIPTSFGQVEVFAVVNNLINQKPPLAPGVNVSPGLGLPYYINTHDYIGRYVTAGLRVKM